MARQIMMNQIPNETKNFLDDKKELGKPVTQFDMLLFMENVLCDLQSVYVLLEMLIENNLIDYDEFQKRLNERSNKQNNDTQSPS